MFKIDPKNPKSMTQEELSEWLKTVDPDSLGFSTSAEGV